MSINDTLPRSRADIYPYLRGDEGRTLERLLDDVHKRASAHPELFRIDPLTGASERPLPERTQGLVKAAGIFLAFIPENHEGRLVWGWDRQGSLFLILPDTARTNRYSDEIPEGEILSESAGMSLTLLTKICRGIHEADPEFVHNRQAEAIRRKELHRRERRLREPPALSGSLDADFDTLAQWCECFAEFEALMNASMLDCSDRNRTRLARACIALEGHEHAPPGELTIYRAMPVGCDIEAGDWVSLREQYAERHVRYSMHGERAVIESLIVDGTEVWSYAGDPDEWVYVPGNTFSDAIKTLHDLWIALGQGHKPRDYPDIGKLVEIELRCEQAHSDHAPGM